MKTMVKIFVDHEHLVRVINNLTELGITVFYLMEYKGIAGSRLSTFSYHFASIRRGHREIKHKRKRRGRIGGLSGGVGGKRSRGGLTSAFPQRKRIANRCPEGSRP